MKPRVFVVDDELSVCKAIARTLGQLNVVVRCFSNAEECFEELGNKRCDLLITDVRMPGLDGMTLLIQARKLVPLLPVLVITGFGDIPMAVKAVKAGAIDFVEKPLKRDRLLSIVDSVISDKDSTDCLCRASLTKAEKKVLSLILHSKNNREIASILHRSVRTVEVHRSRIMHKFGIDNIVDLVKKATAMGLAERNDKK